MIWEAFQDGLEPFAAAAAVFSRWWSSISVVSQRAAGDQLRSAAGGVRTSFTFRVRARRCAAAFFQISPIFPPRAVPGAKTRLLGI